MKVALRWHHSFEFDEAAAVILDRGGDTLRLLLVIKSIIEPPFYLLRDVHVIDIPVHVNDARVTIRNHVLLAIIDYEFKLLPNTDHDVRLEAPQVFVVLARNPDLPGRFW